MNVLLKSVWCALLIFAWLPLIITMETKDRFVLITFLYNETNEERMQEYITCLEHNCAHPAIDTVQVIYDMGKENGEESMMLQYLQSKDIELTYMHGRPTFDHCFQLANTMYPNRKIILSNADIYFNETLGLLMPYGLSGKFLTLTRWNVQKSGCIKPYIIERKIIRRAPARKCARSRHRRRERIRTIREYFEFNTGSQDVWVFETPLRPINGNDIFLGTVGCDSKIAYQAKMSGLLVFNPCWTIQCCHLHLSPVRHYPRHTEAKQGVMNVEWSALADVGR